MDYRVPYSDDNFIYVMLNTNTDVFEAFFKEFVSKHQLTVNTMEYMEEDGHEFYIVQFQNQTKEMVFNLSFEHGELVMQELANEG